MKNKKKDGYAFVLVIVLILVMAIILISAIPIIMRYMSLARDSLQSLKVSINYQLIRGTYL